MRNQDKLLAKAIEIASSAHVKQLDKGGKAYILHPLRVMNAMPEHDPELRQIAVMHDVVEDSDEWTFDRLRAEGFSERVIDALRLLTHTDQDYDDYIDGISSNRDATIVKLGDLHDNSDITRLKGVRDKDFERMRKYHRSFLKLKASLNNDA